MSETPSNRRRKGRNAFELNVDPMDLQPYKKGSWAYEYHLQDWLDGWDEAWQDEKAQQRDENMDIEKVKWLAKKAHQKREFFRILGMANTETDMNKREKQMIEYEVARAEMYKADSELLAEQQA